MAEQEQASRRIEDGAAVDLKKRARRRLVGATALALLAVIVLPMVMDQEPKPTTQDIQIRIPGQDGSTFTSRILPAKPTATPLPPIEATPREAVVPPAAPPAQNMPDGKAPPETAPVAPPPVDKTPPTRPAEKPPEEARAAAILGGGDAPATGPWVVQLGAYQDQANVRLLQKKVKELSLPVYTESVDTAQGARIRVRAGPFATREAAERAQGRLKKIGAGGPNGGVVAQK
jgi:DedD protein